MNNNFKFRNPKLFFQLLSLSIASIFIFGITLFRSNKTVLIFSFYEELMPYLHRISHLGRLIDTKEGEDRSSKNIYQAY